MAASLATRLHRIYCTTHSARLSCISCRPFKLTSKFHYYPPVYLNCSTCIRFYCTSPPEGTVKPPTEIKSTSSPKVSPPTKLERTPPLEDTLKPPTEIKSTSSPKVSPPTKLERTPPLEGTVTPPIKLKFTPPPEDIVKPPSKPKRYALNRLVQFITNSADRLEKRIPSVFQVYRTFRTGLSSFVSDTKEYYRVTSRLWSGESLASFSRRELELYRQFSSDLPLIGLMFVIAFAPGGAIVFPLAYVFPRFLLSQHFWTPQQKAEFQQIALLKRVRHYNSILDYLHLLSQHIEDGAHKERVRMVLHHLNNNIVLTSTEILPLLPLFQGKPYNIDCLSIRHMRHLGKSLGLSVRRRKLVKDALLLHYTDMAMLREGIENMTNEELDRACTWRGLNPEGMATSDKISYLTKWAQLSQEVHEPSVSFLLHLPVLLAYCQPSNRHILGPPTTL